MLIINKDVKTYTYQNIHLNNIWKWKIIYYTFG